MEGNGQGVVFGGRRWPGSLAHRSTHPWDTRKAPVRAQGRARPRRWAAWALGPEAMAAIGPDCRTDWHQRHWMLHQGWARRLALAAAVKQRAGGTSHGRARRPPSLVRQSPAASGRPPSARSLTSACQYGPQQAPPRPTHAGQRGRLHCRTRTQRPPLPHQSRPRRRPVWAYACPCVEPGAMEEERPRPAAAAVGWGACRNRAGVGPGPITPPPSTPGGTAEATHVAGETANPNPRNTHTEPGCTQLDRKADRDGARNCGHGWLEGTHTTPKPRAWQRVEGWDPAGRRPHR